MFIGGAKGVVNRATFALPAKSLAAEISIAFFNSQISSISLVWHAALVALSLGLVVYHVWWELYLGHGIPDMTFAPLLP